MAYFTKDDYIKIEKWIKAHSVKESSFEELERLHGNEFITVIQNEENKKISLSSIIKKIINNVSSDIVNIPLVYGIENISLEEAINIVEERTTGTLITFSNKDDRWEMWQFTGTASQWNNITLWQNVYAIFEYEEAIKNAISEVNTAKEDISNYKENTNTIISKYKEDFDSKTEVYDNKLEEYEDGQKEHVSKVTQQLHNFNDTIQTYTSKVVESNAKVDDFESQINTFASKINTFNSKINNYDYKITTFETQTIPDKFTDLDKKYTEHKESLEESYIDFMSDVNEHININQQIALDRIDSKIATVKTEVSTELSKEFNADIKSRFDEYSEEILNKVDNEIAIYDQSKISKQSDAVADNVVIFAENGEVKDSHLPSDNIAQQNGYYEGMVVGASRSLAGDNEVRAEYVFRPSGGTDIQSGTASINRVLGKTLVWNQLIKNGNFADGENNWLIETSSISNNPYFDITINNNIISLTKKEFNYAKLRQIGNISINHKYLYKFDFWTNGVAPYSGKDNLGASFVANVQIHSVQYKDVNVWNSIKGIVTSTESSENSTLFFALGGGVGAGHELKFKNINVFDLTQMFGEGNEPTVEEFEAMFPNDYYEYNEGTLISNDAVGIKSVGFNAWDEEWELGDISKTGVLGPNPDAIRSANYIKVIPNTNYYISTNNPSVYIRDSIRVRYYDINKNVVAVGDKYSPNNIYTTPDNCYYIKWCTFSSTVVITNYTKGDICINLSHSGIRDGEYEPYEEHKLLFNNGNKLSAIKGKLNGEGESVVVFPDGLRSAGNARDEIVGNVAIKRIGAVDMGSLNWYWQDSSITFWCTFNKAKWVNSTTIPNILTPQYTADTWGRVFTADADKTISNTTKYLRIVDFKYNNNVIDFQQSLQGQILYYELAEPETYILDEAIPMNYVVDDWGTEQRLVADENEVLAPLCYDVTYAINAVDTIRNMPKNYISEETMQAFLSAVGSAMGGTWNMTWNEDMQKYVFTFAPNAVATDVE